MTHRRIGVFTVAAKNYLPFVRVLFDSLRESHPEYERYLCLADRVDGYFEPSREAFKTIPAEELQIEHFEDMTIRYGILEFSTAVKPFMFRWMFEHTDLDSVIYLDPDIFVYSRFEQLEKILRENVSVVLTPHTTEPLEDDKTPSDYNLLQSGGFNLGFAAINRDTEAERFIGWWGRRLQTHCFVDFAKNTFTDQKWCDLAPCLLDRLRVFKDKGYNVAYWNLAVREIAVRRHHWEIGGAPLVFFHFSGISLSDPEVISRHQNRYRWSQLPHLRSLFSDYRQRVLGKGWEESRSWPYAYSQTAEGWSVPPVVRRLFREQFPSPTPLRKHGVGAMLQAMCSEQSNAIPHDAAAPISKLMYYVFESDSEVRRAFCFGTRSGRVAFRRWFEANASAYCHLPPTVAQERGSAARPETDATNGGRVSAGVGRAHSCGYPSGSDDATGSGRGWSNSDFVAVVQSVWRELDFKGKRVYGPIMLKMLAEAVGHGRVCGLNGS